MAKTNKKAIHKQRMKATLSDNGPLLSPLEALPTEILREIVATYLETSRAVVRSQGGCLRLELNPSILRISKSISSSCRKSWQGNRLVRVTYKGDARFRPTAFIPVAANDAYRILTTPCQPACTAFVADLNVTHKGLSSNEDVVVATENVCVITVDAAYTWLAILSCMQLAEHVYAEEPPIFQLGLLVHQRDMVIGRTGDNLFQAIALMLPDSTALNAITTRKEGSQADSFATQIWPAPRDAIVVGGSVYSAWASSLATLGQALPTLRPQDAHLDYCTYICKVLIGLHRLQAGSSIMAKLRPPEKLIITQRACAALLNWTYEFHRNARDEGPLGRLRESWQDQDETTCMIEGCPCLLWTGLDLADEAIVSRDDAEKHGIDFLPWLEVHRWTVALHCRRRLSEGDSDGLIDAKEHMLNILSASIGLILVGFTSTRNELEFVVLPRNLNETPTSPGFAVVTLFLIQLRQYCESRGWPQE